MSVFMNEYLATEAKMDMGRRIFACGQDFLEELAKRRGRLYPPASSPGEFPAKRTGHGQAGGIADAEDAGDVLMNGLVMKLGQDMQLSPYMIRPLEFHWGRLGFEETMKDMADYIRNRLESP